MRARILLGAAVAVAGLMLPSTASAANPKVISDEFKRSYWAYPWSASPVRSRPSTKARTVARLRMLTEDKLPELYLVLRSQRSGGRLWLQIRLPKRPNGSKGWILRSAVTDLHLVTTHLRINRTTLRATLYKNGKEIFQAPVGVGAAQWPTPAGRFYVREKFRVRGTPAYGPMAIGTSAYSAQLTDWPGGGVVGLHGTNQPGLIPGRPSHGCVRFRNEDIKRLYRLMPVGSPIQVI